MIRALDLEPKSRLSDNVKLLKQNKSLIIAINLWEFFMDRYFDEKILPDKFHTLIVQEKQPFTSDYLWDKISDEWVKRTTNVEGFRSKGNAASRRLRLTAFDDIDIPNWIVDEVFGLDDITKTGIFSFWYMHPRRDILEFIWRKTKFLQAELGSLIKLGSAIDSNMARYYKILLKDFIKGDNYIDWTNFIGMKALVGYIQNPNAKGLLKDQFSLMEKTNTLIHSAVKRYKFDNDYEPSHNNYISELSNKILSMPEFRTTDKSASTLLEWVTNGSFDTVGSAGGLRIYTKNGNKYLAAKKMLTEVFTPEELVHEVINNITEKTVSVGKSEVGSYRLVQSTSWRTYIYLTYMVGNMTWWKNANITPLGMDIFETIDFFVEIMYLIRSGRACMSFDWAGFDTQLFFREMKAILLGTKLNLDEVLNEDTTIRVNEIILKWTLQGLFSGLFLTSFIGTALDYAATSIAYDNARLITNLFVKKSSVAGDDTFMVLEGNKGTKIMREIFRQTGIHGIDLKLQRGNRVSYLRNQFSTDIKVNGKRGGIFNIPARSIGALLMSDGKITLDWRERITTLYTIHGNLIRTGMVRKKVMELLNKQLNSMLKGRDNIKRLIYTAKVYGGFGLEYKHGFEQMNVINANQEDRIKWDFKKYDVEWYKSKRKTDEISEKYNLEPKYDHFILQSVGTIDDPKEAGIIRDKIDEEFEKIKFSKIRRDRRLIVLDVQLPYAQVLEIAKIGELWGKGITEDVTYLLDSYKWSEIGNIVVSLLDNDYFNIAKKVFGRRQAVTHWLDPPSIEFVPMGIRSEILSLCNKYLRGLLLLFFDKVKMLKIFDLKTSIIVMSKQIVGWVTGFEEFMDFHPYGLY